MPDELVMLNGSTLSDIATDIHNTELRRQLKGFGVHDSANYALFKKSVPTPAGHVSLLPFPAVAPAGAKKISQGKMLVSGAEIEVVAFRLPAD